jgi:GntR family transcriptional repressor for pyruvate dehydrogenase complex
VQALVTLGLVDVRPGRGATVIGIDPASALDAETVSVLLKEEAVDDLYAFRRLLEVETATRAAQVATDADLAYMEACSAEFERRLAQGEPSSGADDAFHAAVAKASHNTIYATMLDAVSGLIANARRLALQVSWAPVRAHEEHSRLVAAIRAHDPEAAAQVMREHLDSAVEAIQEGRRLQASRQAMPSPGASLATSAPGSTVGPPS